MASFAYERRAPLVDTNVARVLRRVFAPALDPKTGLLYQIKGMQSHGRYVPDSVFREESFTARNDYHSLHVPLQLAVSIPGQKGDVWRFAGGMSYGFLLAGYSKVTINSVYEDESEKHRTLAFYHIVALEPKGNHPRAPHEEGTTLNAFTPALRFDLTYLWQERLVLSAFYEYNLQDIRMRTANNSQVRLHYSGIALGVLFW